MLWNGAQIRKHMIMRFAILSIWFLFLLCMIYGCGGVKLAELTLFDDLEAKMTEVDSLPVLIIRTDDILRIQVSSRNPETVRSFQVSNEVRSAAGEGALGIQEGYRVDEEGMIYLPFIGQVRASGKNTKELRQEMTDSLVKFVPDVSVQIRFINFRVTLLGEVNRPNTYIIPNERLNILEAIGMAGDFTPYANRNSVLIIRQRTNLREFFRVNVQAADLFQSPHFFLNPNDILYVEPLKAKQYATEGDFLERYSTVLFPIVTLLTFFLGAAFSK